MNIPETLTQKDAIALLNYIEKRVARIIDTNYTFKFYIHIDQKNRISLHNDFDVRYYINGNHWFIMPLWGSSIENIAQQFVRYLKKYTEIGIYFQDDSDRNRKASIYITVQFENQKLVVRKRRIK